MANKDVKAIWIENDIEKIQTKKNYYLSEMGPAGEFHKFREVVDNAFDECNDPDSNGNEVNITYDISTTICTVEDNGRGFPEMDIPLDIFCTKIQSGSKFYRDQSGNTSGEGGLGLSACNALSDYFEVTSYRAKEKTCHTLVFDHGVKKKETVKQNKSGRHGSIIRFSNSITYCGKDAFLPYEDALKWVEKHFFFPMDNKKLKVTFDILDAGKLIESRKIKQKPFEELLSIVAPAKFGQELAIEGTGTIDEIVRGKELKKNLYVNVALGYTNLQEFFVDSYCNYINTIDGGVHVDAFTKTYCSYMQNKVKATMSDSQREKTPILWDDVKTGLCAVVSLVSNAQVSFDGNAKVKIVNEALIPVISDIITRKLDEFFKDNPNVFDSYAKIIKLNAKARIEANSVRNAIKVEKIDKLKEYEIKKFIPCNNKVGQWREIFFVEGDSASSGVRNASNPDTDAILLFRGVTKNAFKCSLSELMENPEMKNMVTVLGCGIGKNFDINKLRYDRINLFTDEDVDGFGISVGLLGMLYLYYRPLIEAGKVFKVFTPLYEIDDKDNRFVANKTEMIEIYHKKIVKNYKIRLLDTNEVLSKSMIHEFLEDTYDYREQLIRIAESLGKTSKFLVECILANYILLNGRKNDISDTKFRNKFIKEINKSFKEVKIDKDNSIRGVAEGKYCLVNLNKRLLKNSEDLFHIYEKYGYKIGVKEKDLPERIITVGEFLDECTKYYAKILVRFKGLGEINSPDLQKYAMDFGHRVSVQYTVESAEKELGIFNKLLSSKKDYTKQRKDMMSSYKIKREDLDN